MTQHPRNGTFKPNSKTRYVVALCRSDKTITIARSLFSDFGIHAWVPRIVNKNPKRGEKRVKAAVPGFVFIPEEEFETAERYQKRLLVPPFRPMIFNGEIKKCSHEELSMFESAVVNSCAPETFMKRTLHINDSVTVEKGPFKDMDGIVKEIYFDGCLMVKISSGSFPAIRLPAAFIG